MGGVFMGMVPASWILIFKEIISLQYMLSTSFTCNFSPQFINSVFKC